MRGYLHCALRAPVEMTVKRSRAAFEMAVKMDFGLRAAFRMVVKREGSAAMSVVMRARGCWALAWRASTACAKRGAMRCSRPMWVGGGGGRWGGGVWVW